MGAEEGTSSGPGMDGRGKCFKGEVINGFGDNNRDGLRTYKRRKQTASSSESKDVGNGSVSGEPASKLADQETMRRPQDYPTSGGAGLTGSNDVSQGHWRNYILEQMHRSLSDDEGGIQRCIQDVLRMSLKGASDEPNLHTITDTCRLAFHGIISSPKFTSLCKLLFENFHESRADNLFSLSLVNQRMKDGDYEQSPELFFQDIQKFWEKLEGIGSELIFLAKSLADVSKSYKKKVSTDQAAVCTCKQCRREADGRNCLVCDSCEDMYHVSCIEPAVEEIPPKSWYCSNCSANGMGYHENCVVCERLSAPGTTNEEALFEGLSEESNGDRHQLLEETGTETSSHCKICGSGIGSGGKAKKICEHPFCHNTYHVRCLTTKQLNSHGPRWYCPSCLCRHCLTDKDDEKIVLCDSCDSAYHIYCMEPPRTSIPKGKWFCRQCMVKLQKVRRARNAYEKHTNDGKIAFEETINKRSKRKIEDVFDGKEGMELLVNAILTEDNLGCKQSQG
ncbi:PHD finger protein EHD3 [Linum grandiflorum]